MQKDREQERLVKYRKILRKNHTVYEQVQNCHTETLLDSRIESVLGPGIKQLCPVGVKRGRKKADKEIVFPGQRWIFYVSMRSSLLP